MRNICIYLLLLVSTSSFGQVNLVPNPSFEDTVSCPHFANQIDKAVSWHASKESPDYFNQCDWITGVTAVPENFCGYQYAKSGVAYCGFVAYSKSATNAREYFTCQLLSPLVLGMKYLVSFYISWAGTTSRRVACNKIGTLFSTINYSITNPAPTTNYCQFYSDSIVTDSLNWVLIQGNFIADSNYLFLSIGNFFNDSITDTILFTPFTSHAYYYIDDITVIQDTTTAISESSIENSIEIYPNPVIDNLKINSKNLVIDKINLESYQGKLISQFTNNRNEHTIELSLSNISKGIYFIEIIYTDKKSSYHKFLKQ